MPILMTGRASAASRATVLLRILMLLWLLPLAAQAQVKSDAAEIFVQLGHGSYARAVAFFARWAHRGLG